MCTLQLQLSTLTFLWLAAATFYLGNACIQMQMQLPRRHEIVLVRACLAIDVRNFRKTIATNLRQELNYMQILFINYFSSLSKLIFNGQRNAVFVVILHSNNNNKTLTRVQSPYLRNHIPRSTNRVLVSGALY